MAELKSAPKENDISRERLAALLTQGIDPASQARRIARAP